jgi:acyl-CoA thioester hydrolase
MRPTRQLLETETMAHPDLPSALATLHADFPIVIALPAQWGDMDAFAHVNNTVYLRWFESARIAYGARIGLADRMARENIGPILASISCDYRRPITFPDTVHVGSRVSRIGRTSFTMDHRLVSEAAGAIAAKATSTLVLFDYRSRKSHPIHDALRQAIAALEGGNRRSGQ